MRVLNGYNHGEFYSASYLFKVNIVSIKHSGMLQNVSLYTAFTNTSDWKSVPPKDIVIHCKILS